MIRNALIAIYILVVLAISAVARADVHQVSDAELQNYNFKTHVGEIVALADGSFVLVQDQQNFFFLKSQIDLSAYIGSKVMMSGIELEHQLAPQLELDVVDPLPGTGSEKSLVFFVFGIEEVAP